MNTFFESNRSNQNICCKLYAESNAEIEKVVIFCHGFAGHKDNGAAQTFADKVLSAYPGVDVLPFNWPAHGVRDENFFTLQNKLRNRFSKRLLLISGSRNDMVLYHHGKQKTRGIEAMSLS